MDSGIIKAGESDLESKICELPDVEEPISVKELIGFMDQLWVQMVTKEANLGAPWLNS
jgi:hypothetical protein